MIFSDIIIVYSNGWKCNKVINWHSRLCLKGHRLRHKLQGYGIIPLIRIEFNKSPPCPAAPGPSSVCGSWGTPLWSSPGYTDLACLETAPKEHSFGRLGSILLWGPHLELWQWEQYFHFGSRLLLNRLDVFGKTEGVIEGMIKGVLMLMQHLFNQPTATGKFMFPLPLISLVIPARWKFYKGLIHSLSDKAFFTQNQSYAHLVRWGAESD